MINNAISSRRVGEILKKSRSYVNREISEGRLRAVKIGNTYVVEYGDFLEWCRVYRGAIC